MREDPIEAAWHPRQRLDKHTKEQAASGARDLASDAASDQAQAASDVTAGAEQRGQGAAESRRRLMDTMLQRLQGLPFRRVDVCFGATLLPIMAHQNIQVQRRWVNWEGMPVARHVAEQLAAMESLLSTRPPVQNVF